MNIVWKDIKGYEGSYQVSNDGSVRRLNVNGRGSTREIFIRVVHGSRQVELPDERGARHAYAVDDLIHEAFA